MLKILGFIGAFGITQAVFGIDLAFHCASIEPGMHSERGVSATAEGRLEALGFGLTQLSYQLEYQMSCGDGVPCGSVMRQSELTVLSNRHYRPRRYKGYQQFPLASSADGAKLTFLLPDFGGDSDGLSFQSFLVVSGGQRSLGVTAPMLCKGVPMASVAHDQSQNAEQELAAANLVIQGDFGFKNLALKVEPSQLVEALKADATHGVHVSLSRATQLALATVLDDVDSQEAPLNIAALGWAETSGEILSVPLTREQKLATAEFFLRHLKNPSASFSLYLGSIIEGLVYPPELGEDLAHNWIFVLRLPNLSDHIYWVIVDKYAAKAPYVYGFN